MPLSARGGSTETPRAHDELSVEGEKRNGRSQSEALTSAVFTLKVIIGGFSSADAHFVLNKSCFKHQVCLRIHPRFLKKSNYITTSYDESLFPLQLSEFGQFEIHTV